MTAIVLGWNPDRRDGWQFPYVAAVDSLRDTGFLPVPWPVSVPALPAGTEVWLVLQGAHERGLLGHGLVTAGSPDDGGSVVVDVDSLLPRGEHIPEKEMVSRVPEIGWETDPASGYPLTDDDEQLVRGVWADHAPSSVVDPTSPIPGTLPVGALARILVNRYERDPEAVRLCVAHHGSHCAVCRFNFVDTYGEIGNGFLQVHHIVPGARIHAGYVLDPLTDLVPLCPNCHAMAHRRTPEPYSPAELRRLIRPAGQLEGSVVGVEELRAQEDAARILGT